MNTKLSVWAKGVTGGLEALLAIPILGGSIVLFSGWQALSFAFALHLIALVICLVVKTSPMPSIMGIVTSFAGYLPVVGWFFHTVTAILLLVSAYHDNKKIKQHELTLSK